MPISLSPPVVIAAALFLYFCLLLWATLWRRRFHKQVLNSGVAEKDALQLKLSSDAEFLKLAAGTAVVIGLVLTATQSLETLRVSTHGVVNARMAEAYRMLGDENPVSQLAGIYSLASVGAMDGGLEAGIYESLFSFVRTASPIPPCRRRPASCSSSPTTETAQAVFSVMNGISPGTSLHRINLQQANLSQAQLAQAKLSGANLTGADLAAANLRNATLRDADFYDATLYEAVLDGADASHANLPGVDLANARLRRSSFAGEYSPGGPARFFDATLNGALLYNALACETDFSKARLRDAKLDGIVAYEANFTGADITQASFQNADLSGADLTGVKFDRNALRPDFTCATFAAKTVSTEAFCGSPRMSQFLQSVLNERKIPAAQVPPEVLKDSTLCQTTLPDGTSSDRDCTPERRLVCTNKPGA